MLRVVKSGRWASTFRLDPDLRTDQEEHTMFRSQVFRCWPIVLGLFSIAAAQEAGSSSKQAPNTLSAEEKAEGWQLLFDGKTTGGWRGYKMDAMPPGWWVIDGSMVKVEPGAGGRGAGGGDDIITLDQFDNFELVVDWKIVRDGNSGILYRVTDDAVTSWHVAPEMQILDNTTDPNRTKTQQAGALYDLYAPAEDVTKPVGQWNTAKVVARGNHVEHWLNGVKLLEYQLGSEEWNERIANSKFRDMPNFAKAMRGHICLQDHSNRTEFRNVKIRPLDRVE
jgi:hypothetical protein